MSSLLCGLFQLAYVYRGDICMQTPRKLLKFYRTVGPVITRTDPRPASRAGGGSEFFHTKNSVVASSMRFAMSTRIPHSRVIETPLYKYLIYHIATFLGALVP